jgi:type II secretory pathway component PulF
MELCQFFSVMQRQQIAGIQADTTVSEYQKLCTNPDVKNIMSNLSADMANGLDLADALAKHPEFCPPYVVELIRVGIRNSQLDKFITEIVNSLTQDEEIHRDVWSNLKMPILSFVVLIIAFFIIVFFLLPNVTKMMEQPGSNYELPLISQGLIWSGHIFTDYWYLFFGLLAVSVVAAWNWKIQFPEQYDLFKLKIPFFKHVWYNQLQYRFARIFGLCITSGMTSPLSLQYTAMAMGNLPFKNLLRKAAASMKSEGLTLTEALKKADMYHLIHPSFFVMIHASIGSASLGDVMLAEADHYCKEMVLASKKVGENVGLYCTLPGYAFMALLIAIVEITMIRAMVDVTSQIKGGM